MNTNYDTAQAGTELIADPASRPKTAKEQWMAGYLIGQKDERARCAALADMRGGEQGARISREIRGGE